MFVDDLTKFFGASEFIAIVSADVESRLFKTHGLKIMKGTVDEFMGSFGITIFLAYICKAVGFVEKTIGSGGYGRSFGTSMFR